MSSRQLQPLQRQDVVASPTAIGDPFATIMVPCRPTLQAVVHLKPSVDWVIANNCNPHLTLDLHRADEFLDEADERLKLIPPIDVLQQAFQLFRDAERIPAEPGWLHIAIGIMMDSLPNAGRVSASYRFGIIDSIVYDDAFAGGFSQPVVIRAIRELRKVQTFVPAPADFLKACMVEKRFFRESQMRTEQLVSIRENAEAVVAEFERQFREDFGEDEEDVGPRQLEPDDPDFDYPF
jgi:hypothetical protein